MSTVEELEVRIEQLEYRFQLLLELTDSQKSPLTAAILHANLTRNEVVAIYELIEQTEKDVLAGKGPSRHVFEKALDDIKPLQLGDGDPDDRASWYHAGSVARSMLWLRRYNLVREYLESVHVIF